MLREFCDMPMLSWCIIGDFNNMLSQEEKQGIHPHPNWLYAGFRNVVVDCDLTDIRLKGHPFTCIKSRGILDVVE